MNDFLLMKDSSEGDKGKEAMLDFVLSWTLRVASDAYPDKEVKQTLHKACRRILFKLIFGLKRYEEIERKQCQVCSVQVWKQWNNIDLHANVTLRIDGGEPEYHVIVVENKIYTPLRDNQLGRYKEIILQRSAGPHRGPAPPARLRKETLPSPSSWRTRAATTPWRRPGFRRWTWSCWTTPASSPDSSLFRPLSPPALEFLLLSWAENLTFLPRIYTILGTSFPISFTLQ